MAALLLGSDVVVNGKTITAPLPTRDAVLPMLAVLATAAKLGESLAGLVKTLPVRAALGDRLAHVASERSAALLKRLGEEPDYARGFFAPVGEVQSVSNDRWPAVLTGLGRHRALSRLRQRAGAALLCRGRDAGTGEGAAGWGLAAASAVVR